MYFSKIEEYFEEKNQPLALQRKDIRDLNFMLNLCLNNKMLENKNVFYSNFTLQIV